MKLLIFSLFFLLPITATSRFAKPLISLSKTSLPSPSPRPGISASSSPASTNIPYRSKERDFIRAVRDGDKRSVEYFLEVRNVNVHHHQDWGIVIAASRGFHEIVELLIESGADVNAINGLPLQQAVVHGHVETIEILLKGGADPKLFDNRALKIALKNNRPDIVSLLIGPEIYGDIDMLVADDDVVE